MAQQYGDRVQETFTTTGTGTISLGGAVTGYQAFSAICSNSDTCYYAATDGTNWEVGLGTYTTSGDTLARTTIIASSNSGSAVSWAAGTKNIWLDVPASWFALPTALSTPSANDNSLKLATTAYADRAATAAPGLIKAWVTFNGTAATITASLNVSSITNNATGDFTVNFTSALPSANYAVAALTCDSASGSTHMVFVASNSTSSPTLKSTTQCRIGQANAGIYQTAIFVGG